jgi:hypothetical protein
VRLSIQLLEATYEGDKAARAKALKVWASIVKHVRDQKDKGFEALVPAVAFKNGGFVVYPLYTDLPRDLFVVLGPSGGNSFFVQHGSRFYIYLEGVLLARDSTKYLEDRINSPRVRKTFVHEYVHYLDQQRNPALMRSGNKASKASRRGDLVGYLQTPEEFNANFQMVSQEIEDTVEGRIGAASQIKNIGRRGAEQAQDIVAELKKHFGSFVSFLAFVPTVSSTYDAIMDVIGGGKWHRKWMKRMKTLFDGMRERVMELEL